MQKLPIGIQTFSEIRSGDYIYVDKTKEAYELINDYKYVFLSRPRRFGKSLFLDTLRNIFEGKKELFEGLYIYDKWDWDIKYPVIKISWDGRLRSIEDLDKVAKRIFKDNQERLDIECEDSDYMPNCFAELIKKLYEKYNQKVVILIDEYDKPILDVIENTEQAKEHREYIKGLYSIIKGMDEYVKFAFLTGVSKFSKASIFSGLNMLTDISLNPKYGNICGYTHEDVKNKFTQYLDGVDLEKVKKWYNGYYFLKDRIYNPFDILQFFANNKMYRNYWFETGTPTFLIKLIQKNNYFLPKLSNLVVDEKLLNSFDVENIDVEVILYQSGYLTIDEVIHKDMGFAEITEYKLKLPNTEVKISFSDYIIKYLIGSLNVELKYNIYQALAQGNLERLKEALISLFASIPYTNYTNNNISSYEGFYASIIYVYFQSLGIDIVGEDVTNRGRIDLTLFVEDKIYIVEFKVVPSSKFQVPSGEVSSQVSSSKQDSSEFQVAKFQVNEALNQIKEKKYYEKYLNQNKEIYLVGIIFDEDKKNIIQFDYEKI